MMMKYRSGRFENRDTVCDTGKIIIIFRLDGAHADGFGWVPKSTQQQSHVRAPPPHHSGSGPRSLTQQHRGVQGGRCNKNIGFN